MIESFNLPYSKGLQIYPTYFLAIIVVVFNDSFQITFKSVIFVLAPTLALYPQIAFEV